jgi:hypothetical protein
MIAVGGTGNPLTYHLNGTQSFHIESIVANVDTAASLAGGGVTCDAILRDDAGLLIARSRSSASLVTPAVATLSSYLNEVTFAPELQDTYELGIQFAGLAITTGLTDTLLPPGGSVTVQSADAASIVRGFGMWVEDALDAPGAVAAEMALVGPWSYVPGPGA